MSQSIKCSSRTCSNPPQQFCTCRVCNRAWHLPGKTRQNDLNSYTCILTTKYFRLHLLKPTKSGANQSESHGERRQPPSETSRSYSWYCDVCLLEMSGQKQSKEGQTRAVQPPHVKHSQRWKWHYRSIRCRWSCSPITAVSPKALKVFVHWTQESIQPRVKLYIFDRTLDPQTMNRTMTRALKKLELRELACMRRKWSIFIHLQNRSLQSRNLTTHKTHEFYQQIMPRLLIQLQLPPIPGRSASSLLWMKYFMQKNACKMETI